MKTGCLYALFALFGIFGIAVMAAGLLNVYFPSLHLNPEGIGEMASYPAWVIAIVLFIRGYKQQRRVEAAQPKPPENLKPIDYSRLGKSTLDTTPDENRRP